MAALLSKLPFPILLKIFRRMETESLCRVRQTCKFIDQFVEEHRFLMSMTLQENSPWILNIKINDECRGEPYDLHFWINKMPDIDFSTTEFETTDYNLKCRLIGDPFVALSAVSLRAVEVMDYSDKDYDNVPQVLDSRIPPLLRRLRLNLDWFYVSCKFDPELFTSVKYSRLRLIDTTFPMERMIEMGFQKHCREICFLGRIADPFLSTTFFSHAERVTISFTVANRIRLKRGTIERFILHLLSNVQNAEFLGKLRFLRVDFSTPIQDCVDFVFEGLSKIYAFGSIREDRAIKFFKFPFEKGAVIIFEGIRLKRMVELHIVETYSRKALFDICWPHFFPLPASTDTVERFLNARSEWEAIELIRKETAPLTEYHHNFTWKPVLKDGE